MRVISEIARGGFGIVDKVELDDGTVVARKTFQPSFHLPAHEFQKIKARFIREIRIQSTIQSEYFITITKFDLDCENPWYLMPLAEKNFQQQIEEDRCQGKISSSALADIMNALEELHRLGFVHRDLKPQNILLHEGKWKLTDFGLIRPPKDATTQLTSTGSNWGTEMYCAPEQALAFRNATHSVDIYSFGCILHDIFENSPRLPYNRQTGNGVVGTIIEKCTEIHPNKRFQDIKSLRSSLLTYLETANAKKPTPKAEEWLIEITSIDKWDIMELHEFCRYIMTTSQSDEIDPIFTAMSEDVIQAIYNLDKELWKTIVIKYCEWIEHNSFSFDYCDVISPRLEKIYEMGDFECKANAVLSAAELAETHNRWYVMRAVVRMCNGSIEDDLAQRIAIEITAMNKKYNFIACVDRLGLRLDSYHQYIKSVLEKNV